MASEAASDLKIEISELINLSCHAFLASKCLHELNATRTRTCTAKDDPLTCVTSPQVKMRKATRQIYSPSYSFSSSLFSFA